MEYKRLTKRNEHGEARHAIPLKGQYIREIESEEGKRDAAVLRRLCELEDKIEQGTLIELPCKDIGAFPFEMGAMVWLIYKRYWNVADKNGFWVLRESKVSPHNKKRFGDDFGKFVFLTREEAEKRLKELQNG